MKIFGYEIGRDKAKDKNVDAPAIVPENNHDGSVEISAGGAYGMYIDIEGSVKNESQLITKYRELAMHPEADEAIQDIVNEAIVIDDGKKTVTLNLEEAKPQISKSIQNKINEEFDYLLSLVDFNDRGYELFKRWYVDGRIYFHIVLDRNKTNKGITDLRYVDPRRIKKVVKPHKEKHPTTGAYIFKGQEEYFVYNQEKLDNAGATLKIAKDSIVFSTSGLIDPSNSCIYSHLHKAIKPLNQLRMVEDAMVIYRLARAPERRVFYVDVGNLPKMKAEQYVRDMMAKYKNKEVYDSATGNVKNDKKHMSMMEDFWLPRREGGRGTEVTTLPGGDNLGEMDDVEYLRKKLYKSLNVPLSRLESEATFNMGRGSEITRDEVKFSKFINRLRNNFVDVFIDALEIQLALKGIMRREEFKAIKNYIKIEFNEDNHFSELKNAEIVRERMSLLSEADAFVGQYFSKEWIARSIMQMTEQEYEEMQKAIDKEEDSGELDGMMDDDDDEPAPKKAAPPPAPKPKPEEDEEDDEEEDEEEEVKKEELELLGNMNKFMSEMFVKDDE